MTAKSHNADDVILPFETTEPSRRSFLRMVGFGIAAASVAGCSRAPGSKIVAPLAPSEGVVPGRRYAIATTCQGCSAGCGVRATCLDGRPVKLEGLPGHPVSDGGLCAVGQATVIGLYDSHRFDGPQRNRQPASWADADREITAALQAVRDGGGRVRLLTGSVTSPSTNRVIGRFLQSFRDARHVSYDALSASAMAESCSKTHGVRAIPRHRFDRADVIASFEADFLGPWISPVEHAAAWSRRRNPDDTSSRMARHWQFESRMTVTGGCADERFRVAPWEIQGAIAALHAAVASGLRGGSTDVAREVPRASELSRLAAELVAARGRALVVCGVNDVDTQLRVDNINGALGAFGTTLDLERLSFQRRGSDAELAGLRDELDAGGVDLLIVAGCNPAYDLPGAGGLSQQLRKARLVISVASLKDETTELAHWVCPEPHALEAWGDAEPQAGVFCLQQPASQPLRSTRTLRASLARWMGDTRSDAELVRETWEREIHPRFTDGGPFRRFFGKVQREGSVVVPAPATGGRGAGAVDLAAAPRTSPPAAGTFALVLHPTAALLDGRHAQNPWLQEMADPVTRLAWESWVSLSPLAAREIGVGEGDVVRVECGGGAPVVELPVHLQPGQHDRVVAMPLGHGRVGTDRFANAGPAWVDAHPAVTAGGVIGVNVAPLLAFADRCVRTDVRTCRITRTAAHVELATVQEYQSLDIPPHLAPVGGEVRDAVRSASLGEFRRNPAEALGLEGGPEPGMWPEDHTTDGPRWGLAVDVNACNGCSACVIACQAENNIPVVGRDEVRRHRDMAWMRVDRYAQGDGDDVHVAHQPMMCQHCGNAPCEAVCPVLATVHSEDGLNQQVYNRCVGTRYCANTCPYKVRRFNWFDYPHDDQLANLALNPNVTVRSRGVMEKCSLCVQRIRDASLDAKRRGEPLRDGEFTTACAQSCPTRAITFGNLADPKSAVSKKAESVRSYRVLEELNVRPSVRYLAQIRNRES